MKFKISLLVSCLILTSCQTTWTIVNDNNKKTGLGDLRFKAPLDWVIYHEHYNAYGNMSTTPFIDKNLKRIMMSKNGFSLDLIDIIRFDLKNAFPTIHQSIDNKVLPSELAELYIAEQKMLTGINIFTITRSEPSKIAGRTGFLVQYHFRNTSGLYIEQMTYGFVKENHFYLFTLRAPSLHYFDASIYDFVQMLKSISIRSKSS